jgi:CHAT domain
MRGRDPWWCRLVDDETALLMSDLFKRSSQNQSLSHGEALQQAQLNMLNNAKDDEDARPCVWAPFVVVGEPAKLNSLTSQFERVNSRTKETRSE